MNSLQPLEVPRMLSRLFRMTIGGLLVGACALVSS